MAIAGARACDVITAEQAGAFLREDVEGSAPAVNRQVTVPLTQNQFDALVSFVFNPGSRSFGVSALLKKLNAGAYAGGKQLPSLVRRRNAEKNLFLLNDGSS